MPHRRLEGSVADAVAEFERKLALRRHLLQRRPPLRPATSSSVHCEEGRLPLSAHPHSKATPAAARAQPGACPSLGPVRKMLVRCSRRKKGRVSDHPIADLEQSIRTNRPSSFGLLAAEGRWGRDRVPRPVRSLGRTHPRRDARSAEMRHRRFAHNRHGLTEPRPLRLFAVEFIAQPGGSARQPG
jgi:hypothetical protein